LGQNVEIKINNQGQEIPTKFCETFFHKFNSRNKSGAIGIGTTYAYQTVKMHNGKISVVSNKETGTTVTITLPQ
jgi:signal transduction histidine kinase